jgi:hypothetical protein
LWKGCREVVTEASPFEDKPWIDEVENYERIKTEQKRIAALLDLGLSREDIAKTTVLEQNHMLEGYKTLNESKD